MPGSFPPTHTADSVQKVNGLTKNLSESIQPHPFQKTLVFGSRSSPSLKSKLSSGVEAFSCSHSGPPISPGPLSWWTQALPSLSNSTNTNGLHQIFWELGHLRVETESGGLRADPPSHWLNPLLLPRLQAWSSCQIPAFVSETFRPHPNPSGALSSALQTLRVFFKVNTFPFLRGILVPTLIK